MRRFLVTVFTFGTCAIPLHASAKPRATSGTASHAKSSPTAASPPSESTDALYSRLVAAADADHDAEVSDVELEALVFEYVERQVEQRFQRLDRNRDGRVTHGEVPSMLAERFRRFDADGNGSFTVAELGRVMHQQAAERCRAVFARLDLDGDGALTAADRESARPTRVSKRDVPKPRDERRVAR
jgi:Ca2+-binding EF-hand superfamily protein